MDISTVTSLLPPHMRRRIEPVLGVVALMRQVHNPKVSLAMLPSVVRGFVMRKGRTQDRAEMVSGHAAHFDWHYRTDFPEMRELYTRAKQNQWDADTALDWGVDVDPFNPEVPLLPDNFLRFEELPMRVKLSTDECRQLRYNLCAWMLSQFLHGEQGALFASAQVTESVRWMDGKLYGATQVVDEGRHVETFHRYIDRKLNKLYIINDNLFTIIDSLMTDSRWDMKFLGMQIMVEGLALGAFGTMYKITREPLLRDLLRYIIQDEARHVHYGVLALREHFTRHISEAERREREDWAFEVALLMRDRFMAHEVYEEWFEGLMTRRQWENFILQSPGMNEFRTVMFSRLVPNLQYIGLLSPRVVEHYHRAGLSQYMGGANASELTGEQMLRELDLGAGHPVDNDNNASASTTEHPPHADSEEDEHPPELRELEAEMAVA
ncbi:MAG: ferritin-like domain-containing protein [Myxococcota bacterium]